MKRNFHPAHLTPVSVGLGRAPPRLAHNRKITPQINQKLPFLTRGM